MNKERAKQLVKTPGLITSAIAVLGLSVLFAMIALIYFNPAFGWFSHNTRTDAGGLGFNSSASSIVFKYAERVGENWGSDTPFSANGTADLAKRLHKPGDTYVFKLTLTNTGEQNVTVTDLSLVKPTAEDEVPVTVDTIDYYLGTQIYVRVLEAGGSPVAEPTAVYLLTLSDGEPVFEDKTLYHFASARTLTPGGSLSFVIEFTFENKNEPQDEYQDFGVGNDGVCQRQFYAS